MADKQLVRVDCGLSEFPDHWVEFEVSTWGLDTYIYVMDELPSVLVFTDFLPKHSINWRILDADGHPVKHPGQLTDDAKNRAEIAARWKAVWKRFTGPKTRRLQNWLQYTPVTAVVEAMALSPFRPEDDSGGGAGEGDAGERDEGPPTDVVDPGDTLGEVRPAGDGEQPELLAGEEGSGGG